MSTSRSRSPRPRSESSPKEPPSSPSSSSSTYVTLGRDATVPRLLLVLALWRWATAGAAPVSAPIPPVPATAPTLACWLVPLRPVGGGGGGCTGNEDRALLVAADGPWPWPVCGSLSKPLVAADGPWPCELNGGRGGAAGARRRGLVAGSFEEVSLFRLVELASPSTGTGRPLIASAMLRARA